MKDLRILVLSITLAVVLTACSYPGENTTGSEYMPDMAHSLALEANTYNYYYYNTWDKESTVELAKLVYPRVTVKGTVPRGYASAYIPGMKAPASLDEAELMRGSIVDGDHMNAISVPTNGYVPYYFADSDSGRLQAIAELVDNPFPITENGLARGKNLYNIFCAICHGENGNGLGYIYDTDKNPYAKYPAAPASFLRQEYLEASNGRYYNAIMYGYNVMGAYKDKISYEERWQVIHYIRKLQAAEKKVEYTPLINTLNASFGTPLADFDGGVGQVAGVNNVQGQQLTDNAEAGNAAGSQSLKKK
jgi:mono/diheme cytochrome c family protein